MAKIKTDIHAMKDEEIGIAVEQARAQLVKLRTQAVTEKVEDNSQLAKNRKEVARLLTERRARQIKKSTRA
ncbi:MAG: 50S ribosomal protein L29 [Phycisphaeraceae bacterium]|nr:50S ribosomal protein L29 [Phycisphaeraceae bacterium]